MIKITLQVEYHSSKNVVCTMSGRDHALLSVTLEEAIKSYEKQNYPEDENSFLHEIKQLKKQIEDSTFTIK